MRTLKAVDGAADERIEGPHGINITVVPVVSVYQPTRCPRCSDDRLYRHDKREQRYADVPHFASPTHLKFIRQRWRCQNCKLVFADPSSELDDDHQCTKRLVAHIGEQCIRFTFLEIARQVGLSDFTVRSIFMEHVRHLERTYRFQTPEVLGIDEVHIIDDYRCVLTNVGHNTVYDILPSRKLASLRPYFEKFPEPQKVKVFCTDFWSSYAAVAETYFPKAVLVADRFHVQRMGNNAMEAVRKAYRKSLTKHARIQLKDDRRLLLKNGSSLTEKEREAIERIFDLHPPLRAAWQCKEGFIQIYDASGRKGAETLMNAWLADFPHDLAPFFKEPISVLHSRRNHILNYFDHRFTNGYTESVNALIRSVDRMGRGYSFEAIRAKMLFNRKALEKSAVLIEPPRSEPEFTIGLVTTASMMPRQPVRSAARKLYFGPHIPTLVEMLENGEFEHPKPLVPDEQDV